MGERKGKGDREGEKKEKDRGRERERDESWREKGRENNYILKTCLLCTI